MPAQSLSTKRAEVEFHNFASFGEPERAIRVYQEENVRRGAILRSYLPFVQWMSPFLEIGANAGHSSYMLCNEFGADGYALDLSADALRHGRVLMDRWQLDRAPVRIAGDGARLPFADNSLRMVVTFQTLSQFMDLDAVFAEVKRVLQPGGLFFFAEEPIRRILSLRLYRAPYEEQMKGWEKALHRWGLLGFLTQDVIGAAQEENFGIRQNHTMGLWEWDQLIRRYFVDHEYRLFIANRGWGERMVLRLGRKLDKHGSDWVPARLLGGTLAAVCRKEGHTDFDSAAASSFPARFHEPLRCPDCAGRFDRSERDVLLCLNCGYTAPCEEDVYNLLPTEEKHELYPGLREDVIDFSAGDCADRILEGFYDVEGVYGNKYRWMGPSGKFRLRHVQEGAQTLRIRGHVHPKMLASGQPARIQVRVNGAPLSTWHLDRPGLFLLEAPLPAAPEYVVEVAASPSFHMPPDERVFTVNLSMMRLVR
jgi:ubiquinone/menaquinone biosynthesis C-methylase UbiE